MVSLWPWKAGDDAATFEKTLSSLATKISKTSARNDKLRQRSRRVRVMWTLYAGFAYILAALLLILVTGWKNWGAMEISIMAGGPVVIYLVRTSLSTYYDYRIANTQTYLNTLYKERDSTIERLKAATKYNSTQQLLEKYGSSKPKAKQQASPSSPRRKSGGPSKPTQLQGPRTNMPPPPTANIQRPPTQNGSRPTSPNGPPPAPFPPEVLMGSPVDVPPGAEFAPNAYGPADLAKQYSSSPAATFTQHHWYDRILDALLGEDETQPKNRLALICSECRLVNGQAPPGVRSLEDVGRWRCSGCGAWNGKEKVKDDAVANLAKAWEEERKARESEEGAEAAKSVQRSDDEVKIDEGSDMDLTDEGSQPPARSTRSKAKGKGRKE